MNIETHPIIDLSKVHNWDELGKFSTVHTSHIVAISKPKCVRTDKPGMVEPRFDVRTADQNQYTVSFRPVARDEIDQAAEVLKTVHLGLNKLLHRKARFIGFRGGRLTA